MRKHLGNNIFIALYSLMYVMYPKLNRGIYMNALVNLENIFLVLSIVSILYTLIFKDKFIKRFYIVNISIIFIFITTFVFLKPTYTYNQAKDIIETKVNLSEKITDYNTFNYQFPGINILLARPKKNLLIQGDYRFFFETKDSVISYRFDCISGITYLFPEE